MSRKQIVSSILVFILGFSCSLILLVFLSSTVYKSHLEDLQIQFRAEQNIKAMKATKAGDNAKAFVCRQNVVDTYNLDGFLDVEEARFNLWSAVQLYILEKIKDSTHDPQGERLAEGLERGKLAYTLDTLGMKSKAEEEWLRAAEVTGYSQKPDALKQLISQMIETETSVLD